MKIVEKLSTNSRLGTSTRRRPASRALARRDTGDGRDVARDERQHAGRQERHESRRQRERDADTVGGVHPARRVSLVFRREGAIRHGDRHPHAAQLRRRRARRPGRGPQRADPQPGDRRADRDRAAVRRRRRRPRRAGRAPRLRRLGQRDARRALDRAAGLADADRGARRRAGRAGGARRRQADRGRQGRRDPGRRRQPALLRRRRAAPGGPRRRRVHGRPHVDDPPRADRRRRPDRAVELPADDGRLEDRPGAGGRQHGRAEAGRDDAADDAAARRAGGRAAAARACST